ncbi:MAG: MFS transporter, partial [Planctomycetota bacterium]
MNARYERLRWRTFGVTWLVYAVFYFTRNAWSAAKVALGEDPRLQLKRSDYGLVDSAQLGAYMAGQFIFGPLGDRFGPRKVLLGGMAFSVWAAVACGFSTTLLAFVSLAVVQGLAQSTGWSNTTKTVSNWFSLHERGRVFGWWCSTYAVGAAAAGAFGGWIMNVYARPATAGTSASAPAPYWPASFWGAAAALGVVAAIAWLLLRDKPEDVGLPPIEVYHGEAQQPVASGGAAMDEPSNSWAVISSVIRSPSIWLLGLAYFSIKFTRYAFACWGPMYVADMAGGDAFSSNLTAAVLPIGGVLGVVACGFVSDQWFNARRPPVAIMSLLITAALMLLGLAKFDNIWLTAAFLFAIGFFLYGPDAIISATAAIDFGTKRGAGTAIRAGSEG